MLEQIAVHIEKLKLDTFTIQRNQTINILEDNIRIYIYEPLGGKGFLKTQKRAAMKGRMDKIKNASSSNTLSGK